MIWLDFGYKKAALSDYYYSPPTYSGIAVPDFTVESAVILAERAVFVN
ncbi:hypothetical protein COI_0298 [Mannheimia haemolytica serotype A2 str. OVINE]|nr:hypothetical protein COI_0298 [Mannheimia haemolytica serotype A2 str. OVINE]